MSCNPARFRFRGYVFVSPINRFVVLYNAFRFNFFHNSFYFFVLLHVDIRNIILPGTVALKHH